MASSTTQTQDSSSSSSKRHFHWTNKVGTELDDPEQQPQPSLLKSSSSSATRPLSSSSSEKHNQNNKKKDTTGDASERRKKLPQVAVARLRSVVLSALGRTISHHHRRRDGGSLGSRVVGTLFGSRRGHVHFAFQKDPSSQPTFLIELATPISGLVKEMASGLVRIALECDKQRKNDDGKRATSFPLLEENTWRTYCNGKKSGFATRRECGPHDWKILKAVEPISMGAGVLPPLNDNDKNSSFSSEDDVMYMRAKFERIVGSRDSEAFYMMNPDSNGAPELSIYLLRL